MKVCIFAFLLTFIRLFAQDIGRLIKTMTERICANTIMIQIFQLIYFPFTWLIMLEIISLGRILNILFIAPLEIWACYKIWQFLAKFYSSHKNKLIKENYNAGKNS